MAEKIDLSGIDQWESEAGISLQGIDDWEKKAGIQPDPDDGSTAEDLARRFAIGSNLIPAAAGFGVKAFASPERPKGILGTAAYLANPLNAARELARAMGGEEQGQAVMEQGLSGMERWKEGVSAEGKKRTEKKYFTTGEDAAWRDPLAIAGDVAEAFPSMLIPMGPAGLAAKTAAARAATTAAERAIAGGATREVAMAEAKAAATAAAKKAATVAGVAGEGAVVGGAGGQQTYQTVLAMPEEDLQQSPQYQELLSGGMDPAQAREQLAMAAGKDAGVASAVLGAIAGKVGAKFTTKILTEPAQGGLTRNMVQGAVSEGVEESLQGAGEQVGQNLAVQQNVDANQSLTEGVGEQMVGGAVAGGVMGGGLGAMHRADAQIGNQPVPERQANAALPSAPAIPSEQELQAQAAQHEGRAAELRAMAEEARGLGNEQLAAQYDTEAQASDVARLNAETVLKREYSGLTGVVNRNPELVAAAGQGLLALEAPPSRPALPAPAEDPVMVVDAQGQARTETPTNMRLEREAARATEREQIAARGDIAVPSAIVPQVDSRPAPAGPAAGLSVSPAALPAPAEAPVMVADSDGVVRTETPQNVRNQRATDRAARADALAAQGDTVIPTARAGAPLVVRSGGNAWAPSPAGLEQAQRALKARGMEQTHAVVRADDGYALAPNEAVVEPAAAPQATAPAEAAAAPLPSFREERARALAERQQAEAGGKPVPAATMPHEEVVKTIRAKMKKDKEFRAAFNASNLDVDAGGSFLQGWLDAEKGEFNEARASKPTPDTRPNGYNPVDDYRSGFASQGAGAPIKVRVLDPMPKRMAPKSDEAARAADDRRQAAAPADAERRQGQRRLTRDHLNKPVEEMAPEELAEAAEAMRSQLLESPLTGLPTKAVWGVLRDSGSLGRFVASLDADALKWFNDNIGHEIGGDKLLGEIGRALKAAGVDAYHISGDEFYATADNRDELENVLKRAQAILAGVTISGNGWKVKGVGFSYGIAEDMADAEHGLHRDKAAREAAGLRAGRGEVPAGATKEVNDGQEDAGREGRGAERQPGDEGAVQAVRADDRDGEAGGREGTPRDDSEVKREAKAARMRALAKQSATLRPQDELQVAIAKLGGLDRRAAEAEGIDPAEFSRRAGSQWVFRAKGGKTFDQMAEALAEAGYPVVDERGSYSPNVLLDALDRSLRGDKVFTPQGDQAAVDAEQARRAMEEGDTAALEELAPASPDTAGIAGVENGGEFLPQTRVIAALYGELMARGWPIEQIDARVGEDADAASAHDALTELLNEEAPDGRNESGYAAGEALRAADGARQGEGELPGFDAEAGAADYGDLTDEEIERVVFDGLSIEEVRAQRASAPSDFSLQAQTEDDIRAKEAREQDAAAAEAADRQRQIDATADNFTLSTGTATAGKQARPAVRGPGGDLFASPRQPAPSKERIEDFGEKIGGARKDVWGTFNDTLTADLPSDHEKVTLSKHFPEPDYEKLIAAGAPAESLAAIKAIRDQIPAKPRRSWKLNAWVENLRTLRELSAMLMDGKLTVQQMRSKLNGGNQTVAGFVEKLDIYVGLGYPLFLKAEPASLRWGNHFTYDEQKNRTDHPNAYGVFYDGRRVAEKFFTEKKDAIAFLRSYLEGLQEQKADSKQRKTKLDLYRITATGKFVIGKNLGGNRHIDLRTFDTRKEALQYLDAHESELVAELEKIRKEQTDLTVRRSTNDPRQGEDFRLGEDIAPDQFGNAFGFRGVEFGNWVEQGRRRQDLNNAFDALMDMAKTLGIPPKAVSLNGSLGLAFGARGISRAAAHYEPGKVVINLTKKEGAGSLGHEWWHAMDNYFSRARSQPADFVSARVNDFRATGLRPEVLAAYKNLMKHIDDAPFVKRSRMLDKKRPKDYWSTPEELSARAFESYLIAKAKERGEANDYLANVIDRDTAEVVFTNGTSEFPYPFDEEMKPLIKAFDQLFETIKTKETDSGVALYSRNRTWYYSPLQRAVEGMKQETAPAAQWMATIKKLPGVKPDELEWTGLTDWLELQAGKVTKAQILGFIDQNGVQVEEVVKGEGNSGNLPEGFKFVEVDGMVEIHDENGNFIGEGETRQEAIENAWDGDYATPEDTKYENYSLPGGKNYRELLLTLPEQFSQQGLDSVAQRNYKKKFAELDDYQKRTVKKDAGLNASNYKSSHWDEANIIAHIRFNERTDADGKKVLFIEEIQSDWAQDGKKRGFAHELENGYSFVEQEPGFFHLRQLGRSAPLAYGTMAEVEAAARERNILRAGIPVAPFVGKTDVWVALAIKRMIAYAAENGFDRVAFVNGEQSSERYSLSKQVDSITYTTDTAGRISLYAKQYGDVVITKRDMQASELDGVVGKEIAQKILNGEGKENDMGERTMSGIDLKVGGEGMKAFYDKIVPTVAKDVLKKLGGGKLQPVRMTQFAGRFTTDDSRDVRMFDTREEAEADAAERDAIVIDHSTNPRAVGVQLGFDITPEMRDKAASGLPLFSHQRRGTRAPWEAFPAVEALHPLNTLKEADPETYRRAKAGDADAALDLVGKVVTDADIERLRGLLGDQKPVIVPVVAEEKTGRNRLPQAFAAVLGDRLGLETEGRIVQTVRAHHTDAGAFERIARQPQFGGPVEKGQTYLIVDDTVALGGTLAALRGYIESRGGKVVLATTLTGFQDRNIITPTPAMVAGIRAKHPDLPKWWNDEYGFQLEHLTQGELGHLKAAPSLDAIRDRLAAGRLGGNHGQDEGASRGQKGRQQARPLNTFRSSQELAAHLRAGALGDSIDRLTAAGQVILHDTVPADVADDAQGWTDKDGRIHLVAAHLTPASAEPVLLHEAFHSGGQPLIGSKAWDGLQDRLKALYAQFRAGSPDGKARQFFDRAAKRVEAAGVAEADRAEEFGAYAIEEYAGAPRAVRSWVDDALGTVKAWALRRFGRQLGAVTPAQLRALAVAALRTGRTGKPAGPGGGRRFSVASATSEIGAPTGSAAFRRWFGDSKIVDADGRPLVVYHGTRPGNDIEAFQIPPKSDGAYFTPEPRYAEGFTAELFSDEPKAGAIYPVYLSIKNPYVVEAIEGSDEWDSFVDRGLDRGDLERQGHDGAILRDANTGEIDQVMAFKSEQIKSATGNRGTFDGGNSDIRYSKQAPQNLYGRWQLPEPKQFVINLLDRFHRVGQVQRAVQEQGGTLTDATNVHAAEQRYHSRASGRLTRFRQHTIEPLFKAMAKAGVNPEDVGLYLYALHAPERNAQIRKIQPYVNGPQGLRPRNDAGSGMSDQEAAQILADFQQRGLTPKLDKFGKEFQDITRRTRNVLVSSGLEDAAAVAAWQQTYQNYVPLAGRDEANSPSLAITGQGFSVKGGQKRAMGRRSKAKHILEQVIAQHEAAVIRAEKNDVVKHLLRFVQANPDPDLWELNPTEARRYINAAGVVESRSMPSTTDQNVVALRINGKDQYILIKDETTARAIKQLDNRQLGLFLQGMAKVSRFLSAMFTSMSPPFVAVNFVRDLGTAMIHGTQVKDAKFARAIMRNIGPAMAELIRDAKTGNSQLVQLYEQAGGRTGMVTMIKDVEEKHAEIQSILYEAKGVPLDELLEAFKAGPKEGAKALGDKLRYNRVTRLARAFYEAVETVNGVVENTTRLAAFMAAQDRGMPINEAGSIAKNLTVNFNRKGEWAPAIGALYIFFNASVQGSARMAEALKDKRVWGIAAGIVAASFAVAMLNYGAGDDDEDGREDWEQISDWDKSRNLVLMTGDGSFVKVPLPLGYNVFHMIGTEMARATRSKRPGSGLKAAAAATTALFTAFNPLGEGIPSVLSPFWEIQKNEDHFGSPIRPEYKSDLPASQQFYGSMEGTALQRGTQALNAAAGGNAYRSSGPVTDWNPEHIDHVLKFFGGGALRFATDLGDAAGKLVMVGPDAVDPRRLPFARQVTGKIRPDSQIGQFFENKEEVEALEREIKGLRKQRTPEALAEAARLQAEHPTALRMAKRADKVSKADKESRLQEQALRNNMELSPREKFLRQQQLREQRAARMKGFNRRFNQATEVREEG